MKRWLLLPLCLSLQACFQAQLNGGVGGSDIELHRLSQSDQSIYQSVSWDRDFLEERIGSARWQSMNPKLQLLWVGVFLVPRQLDESEYYLVRATGGTDWDSDRDRSLDSEPALVRGSWHSLVPGEQLRIRDNRVSLLTEAVYQYTLEHFDWNQAMDLGAALDELARGLVGDVNQDGEVNYSDVLRWNTYLHRNLYLGETKHLDELATAISLGAPPATVQWAALRVIESARSTRG